MARSAKRAQGATEAAVTRRFREVMAGRKITQVQLAEQVGLSRTHLTRVLNGHVPSTFTEAVDIAHALGLYLSDVVAEAEHRQAEASGRVPLSARVDDLVLQADLEDETHPTNSPAGGCG